MQYSLLAQPFIITFHAQVLFYLASLCSHTEQSEEDIEKRTFRQTSLQSFLKLTRQCQMLWIVCRQIHHSMISHPQVIPKDVRD